MSELPSPSLPEMATSEPLVTQNTAPEPHPAQRGKKRTLLIGGAVMVGIGTLCGLGYAAWAGYLPNPLIKRPTPEQLFAAIHSINSAQTTVDVHFALEPREEDVEPLDFSLFEEPTGRGETSFDEPSDDKNTSSSPALTNFTQMLPSDLDLNLSITSSFSRENKKADQETHIAGTYTGNNISANINLTTRTVGGVTYVKPDAIPLPIPIFDMSALEGKWINFDTESNDREVFTRITTFENKEETKPQEENETGTDPETELLVLLEQAVQDGAIIFSIPERITYNETRAWYTEAVIDGEKLRETVLSIGEDREALFPEITKYSLFTDKFLKNSEKERAKDTYKEVFKRMELSATINDDGSPLMVAFSTRLAPKLEEDIFKDRQITFETEIHFNSINTPITLTAPEDTISTEEAIELLMGTDPNENLADKQRDSVSDLRNALSMYKKEHDKYPATLNELIGEKDEYRKVTTIPVDIVTEQPYEYTTTENGYTLLYQMPETSEEDTLSLHDTTINGTNTATELLFSEEGAKLTDEDEDGISAYDETVIYNTSDNDNDSDGDGFDDKTEIDGGYNPAGDGPLITAE